MRRKNGQKRILAAAAVSILLTVALSGCNVLGDSHGIPAVETVPWKAAADNYVQFKTNDNLYWDCSFAKVFSLKPSGGATITIECKKVSGDVAGGFGMVLFGDEAGDNFYAIEITPSGTYGVFKKLGGVQSTNPVIPWTASSAIHSGLGVDNTLSLTLTGTSTYELYINGTKVASFARSESSCPETGYYGFFATVSSSEHEDFPFTSEDMLFKRLSPAN